MQIKVTKQEISHTRDKNVKIMTALKKVKSSLLELSSVKAALL